MAKRKDVEAQRLARVSLPALRPLEAGPAVSASPAEAARVEEATQADVPSQPAEPTPVSELPAARRRRS